MSAIEDLRRKRQEACRRATPWIKQERQRRYAKGIYCVDIGEIHQKGGHGIKAWRNSNPGDRSVALDVNLQFRRAVPLDREDDWDDAVVEMLAELTDLAADLRARMCSRRSERLAMTNEGEK